MSIHVYVWLCIENEEVSVEEEETAPPTETLPGRGTSCPMLNPSRP